MSKQKIDTDLLGAVHTPEGMVALRKILIDLDRRLSRMEYIIYGVGVLMLAIGTKEYVVAILAKMALATVKGA